MMVETERPLRKVLVGYDGSDQARRALDFAVMLAANATGVQIHLACVVQKPVGAPDPVSEELMDSLRAAAREELLDAGRLVTKGLSTPIIHLEIGNPGEKLLELADRIKPDVVVLGTVQHSTTERLLGTVSSLFLKSRRYPLLVVP